MFAKAKPGRVRHSSKCFQKGHDTVKTQLLITLLGGALLSATTQAADPAVSNVRASQRPGTKLVDIYYDLADPDSSTLSVSVAVSTNGGSSYTLPASSFSGTGFGPGVTRGSNKKITWDAGADWNGQLSANVRFRVTASDSSTPSGMALIPAGSFTMGATTNMGHESYSDEVPQHSVYVSAFYMDRTEVTKALWDEVRAWGLANGYTDLPTGGGKATNHPVHSINWYAMVKWCNARSEKENLTPVYCTSSSLATVYKAGSLNVANDWVKWTANGYRLPTEAEWEKAARGGTPGHRFAWSDSDTIQHSRANYYSSTSYAYDTSPTRGYHPTFNDGVSPYTSPVGTFAATGYAPGLYDMAGNVWEWCWDWYSSSYYGSSPTNDPRGPTSGSNRVFRGGCWGNNAYGCRAAYRYNRPPGYSDYNYGGFRCVRAAGQ
jgi:formylglycine-generating enzyme required for sulfatase activity